MATINRKATIINSKTHEGAPATIPNADEQLRRSIMACMLWEDNFYEDGETIGDRIKKLIPHVKQEKLEEIARQAKYDQKIRHAPIYMAVCMAACGKLKAKLLSDMIRRPDELAETLALYWKDGKTPIAKQVKLGLADAFKKFDEYQLAKWNRGDEIKLRDVLFLCHAKPKDKEQEALWKRLIDNTLTTPDTWEVELSASKDKKSSWSRLLSEKKLGSQALLMNIRNILESGIEKSVLSSYLKETNFSKILPFQFINAARYNPSFESETEEVMLKAFVQMEKLDGRTAILVDVSGSMDEKLSTRGELLRTDAACGLAMVAREKYSDVHIFSFSRNLVEIPVRHGFALRDAILSSQEHSSTMLGASLNYLNNRGFDRIIVITDEQSHDQVSARKGNYIVNVGTNDRGVAYGQAIHINGWSEKVLDYIQAYERSNHV